MTTLSHARPTGVPQDGGRLAPVRVDGRHLVVDGRPWRVRAVTYGSFGPRRDGAPFPEAEVVRRDLAQLAAAGFNALRTYALPPADLLDAAEELGLRLLVGLHYADWRVVEGGPRAVARTVRDAGLRAVDEALAALAGRSCVAAVVVGNEVPGDLVRLHGVRPVERVLSDLVAAVHEGAPGTLATYASYPTTEYLRVDGQDLACANVFLSDPAALRRYLQHLGGAVGDVPLVVSELGVDAAACSPAEQAAALAAQLDVVDETGCAGAAVFSFTDDWEVGGHPVQGWSFGLTDAQRSPRPALAAAGAWAARPLSALRERWPTVTAVVCAYQEQERLGRALASLAAVDYPGFEVVVCDDGSTDGTVDVARRFDVRLLELPHGGLSAARNAGALAARGEIVAFLDADAACHPEWPYHLALSFEAAADGVPVVASGGPNLPAHGAPLVARAVDLSPGNPVEVLTSADRAEHVPGCNSAYRRDALLAAGGFLPDLWVAGDDVDLCWRLLDSGGAIAFSPAAQVRHERRGTVRGYLRQQRGYGRAERLVSGRHPHRFNRWGQAMWSGSVYGGPLALPRLLRPVVLHGASGSAAYQPVTGHRGLRAVQTAAVLVAPSVALGALALVASLLWAPALLVAGGCLALLAAYALAVAAGTQVPTDEPSPHRVRALVVALHLLQPLVRVQGSLTTSPLPPLPRDDAWSGDRGRWLDALHVALAAAGCSVRRSGPHDRHDLQVQAGVLLHARVSAALRWGRTPLLRTRLRPRALPVLAVVGLVALTGRGAALLVLLLLGAVVEGSMLTGRLRRAVADTAAGAA